MDGRRGAAEAAGLTAELAAAAGAAAAAISHHMAREEAAVLPLLAAGLCTHEQRAMVWRTLRAMPLRLLERMLPWLAGARAPSNPPACSLSGWTVDAEQATRPGSARVLRVSRGAALRGPRLRPLLHTQATGTEGRKPDRRRARPARQAS
jgi:hypothetical protein